MGRARSQRSVHREARLIATAIVKEHGVFALQWPMVRRNYRLPLWARLTAYALMVLTTTTGGTQ